jgi:hypothetical protein
MKLLRAVGHYAGYPVGAIVLGLLWIFTTVSSLYWKTVVGDRERKPEVSQSLAGGDK